MGLTQSQAALQLGLSLATYKRYLSGGAPVAVDWACGAQMAGVQPWSIQHADAQPAKGGGRRRRKPV